MTVPPVREFVIFGAQAGQLPSFMFASKANKTGSECDRAVSIRALSKGIWEVQRVPNHAFSTQPRTIQITKGQAAAETATATDINNGLVELQHAPTQQNHAAK